MMNRFLFIPVVLALFGASGCEAQTPTSRTPVYQVYAFTADWCQACQHDKPKLAELRQRGVQVTEIDYDTRLDLARKYQVARLPTYIVLKDGKEVERTESILLLIKILRGILRLL